MPSDNGGTPSGDGGVLTCGPGTLQEGNLCVPGTADGGGSTQDGGTTDGGGGSPLTCGAGTHQQGSQCLPGDPVDQIEVLPSSAATRVGGKVQLTAVARRSGGAVDGLTFSWSSSDQDKATVDSSGQVTGLAVGTTRITASARGVTSAPVTVTVEPGPSFQLSRLEPASGPSGMPLTLTGTSLGTSRGSTEVHFGTTVASDILFWSDTQIVVRVPGGVPAGALEVKLVQQGSPSNALAFTVNQTPYVVSAAPRSLAQRTQVRLKLSGYNLGGATSVGSLKAGNPDTDLQFDSASIEVTAGTGGAPDALFVNATVAETAVPGSRTLVIGTTGGSSPSTASADNEVLLELERGNIETVAGNGLQGASGNGGKATSANLNTPAGLWYESGLLFIADMGNDCVRVVNRGAAAQVVGGAAVGPGRIDVVAGTCGQTGGTGDGGPARQATLHAPRGLLVLPGTSLLVIADSGNHKLRVVNYGATAATWGTTTVAPGAISTLAGNGTATYAGEDVAYAATTVSFNQPSALAYDKTRQLLYVADSSNHRVRVLNGTGDAVPVSGGSVPAHGIARVAGTGSAGSEGDGGFAVQARLNAPQGLALDGRGILYIADTNSNALRAVNTTEDSLVISGLPGETGVTLAAASIATVATSLGSPMGLAAEPLGIVYSAAQVSSLVRGHNYAAAPVRRGGRAGDNLLVQGTAGTMAGSSAGFGGDNGLGTTAKLSGPRALALDVESGSLYVADTDNHRIRRVLVQWPSNPFSGELGPFPSLGAGVAVLNTDTGVLTPPSGAPLYTGVRSGVFPFASINLPSALTLKVEGDNPLVLGASGALSVHGTLTLGTALGTPQPGSVYTGPATTRLDPCCSVVAAHATKGSYSCGYPYSGSGPRGMAYGAAQLVPLAGGGGASSQSYFVYGGGAVLLAAQGPVSIAGTVSALQQSHSYSYRLSGGSYCGTSDSGAGGAIRVVSTTSVTVSGTLSAGSSGRIRLESPAVTTAGATVSPTPSTGSVLGSLPGL